MIKKTFAIKGMHCASCVYVTEEALKKIPQVKKAVVNLATGKATIEAENEVDFEEIKKAVEAVGYQVISEEEGKNSFEEKIKKEKEKELKKLKQKTFLSLSLALIVIWGSFPFLVNFAPSIIKNFYLHFFLATVIQFFGGYDFYRAAFSSLKNRYANMDVLVVLGTTVAYFYSTITLFFPQIFPKDHDVMPYFDVSSVIIALVLLGRYLENAAKSKTGEAIKKLIALQAKEANLIIK
ncbi:MAG: cation transporter [Microgenomates group bacterium]